MAAFVGDREPGERADAAARALQAAVVHRRPARGLRDLGLGVRALPLHRRSTCRTTSATRRCRPGCATCRSRVATFFVAPVAAALLSRVPARVLMSVGLAPAGAGLLLMSGINAGSEWTTLLGGFLVLGVGVGLLNPVIADVALSVVPKERSGMAAGINDTFRQVGVAVGVAVWGAIFVARGADKVSDLTAGTARASGDHPRQLVEAASSGSLDQASPRCRRRRTAGGRARRPRGLPRRLQRGADAGRRGLLRRRRPGPLAGSRARDRARTPGATGLGGDSAGRGRLVSPTQRKRPPCGGLFSRGLRRPT